jgi:hypothetical protein
MMQCSVTRVLSALFLLLCACPGGSPPADRASTPATSRQPAGAKQLADKGPTEHVALTPSADLPAVRCTPCLLQIHTNEPAREIRAELTEATRRLVVQAPSPDPAQLLPIDNSAESVEAWEVGTDDINFDGYADLYLVTSRGSVNEFARYFRYVPDKHRFEDIGTFPVFKLDRLTRRLFTYVKNGSAGLEHESCEYSIVDGKPVMVRQERQSATEDPLIFVNTIRERTNGELKTVGETRVRAPAPD